MLNRLNDIATVIGAVAGLWGLSFAWFTYVFVHRKDVFSRYEAVCGVCRSLRSELEFMKFWSGSYGDGYSRTLKNEDLPKDWEAPSRIIWRFPSDTITTLPQSPWAGHVPELLSPFLKLSFSINKFLQFYEEYRTYVLSRPELYHGAKLRRISGSKRPLLENEAEFSAVVFDFNRQIHLGAIGGKDSDDEACLYKTHKLAFEALNAFERTLKKPVFPWPFWIGHILFAINILAGLLMIWGLFVPSK